LLLAPVIAVADEGATIIPAREAELTKRVGELEKELMAARVAAATVLKANATASRPKLRGFGGGHKMLRLTPTKLRGKMGSAPETMVQLAEIELRRQCSEKIDMQSAQPQAASPASWNPGETPDKVVDGQYSTKWLDSNTGVLTITFGGAAPVADAWRFATADDSPERDPVSWILEGSADGVFWATLDHCDNCDSKVPTDRQKATEWLPYVDAKCGGGGGGGKSADDADDLDITGCGGGCAFLIIFFCGGFTYFVAGALINYKKYEKRGVEAVPHLAFWKDLPFLVKDGVVFTVQKARGRGTYATV